MNPADETTAGRRAVLFAVLAAMGLAQRAIYGQTIVGLVCTTGFCLAGAAAFYWALKWARL